ncbi:hypothetical protein D7B24_000375 [Verticillium nonalfalfae]|uniref:Secreted protein n=1 Tax=Verticillium nonalfalfae TaxID=1051616 RepID=A0A3M9Y396_9PEZI|nr:uncharacterized protein D7B24_000375 [Verticillium nonalfalfae]RNJ54532.1 hypothetical protein D7B24_000375 [Verticillium nonalfalfae]
MLSSLVSERCYRLSSLLAFALTLSAASSNVNGQAIPPASTEIGVSAFAFDMSQVSLNPGRWLENQDRTLSYIKFVDVDRLLYVFRQTHGLPLQGAQPNGGWDAPDFPFRSHFQGHFLNAWSYCWAVLRDEECRDRASYFATELAKCQGNNDKAGFNPGYLSGFPESEIEAVEKRTLSNGNVPYYSIHKTMAGLLDVWRHIGDETARDVLLGMAGWVDLRTGKLSYSQMQAMMSTEFGGMNEVMADIFHQTGDERWLTVAQRFDHASVFDPLAGNRDSLNGLHANTQVPKWIGAAREYKATGSTRYSDIAHNAWNITVQAHTYAIGANSQSEHFRPPNAIASYLDEDTAEACNTYNMLKLTRELWVMDPSNSKYFDFYEQALINHAIGQQDPSSAHGHVTYFTSLNPGGHRGVGPAWGGGTWSTDYGTAWCCQGTALETNTKLMDSIYFYDESSLYVNLYAPSRLNWTQRKVTVLQETDFPLQDTSTLTVKGGGDWDLRVRIPIWSKGATIAINGQALDGVETVPGTYATIKRSWGEEDIVTITLPMALHTISANDEPSVAALAYGPVVLAANYGSNTLDEVPSLDLGSVRKAEGGELDFEAASGGSPVKLGPFYEAHGFNYNVYWATSGDLTEAQ